MCSYRLCNFVSVFVCAVHCYWSNPLYYRIELMLIPQKGLLSKQESYTRDLLQKYNVDDMSSSDVVMRERKQEEEPVIQGNNPYASMVVS